MPVSIRTATEDDLPAILDIYNEAILNTTAVYDYDPHTLDMRRQWFATKQQQHMPVFVADVAGVVAGFSSFGPFRAWAAYKHTVEDLVYVAVDQRGQGIGKLLIPPLIEAARNMNVHVLVAGIDATNEASIRLHTGFGFEKVAHFKQVGWKFGRWLDLTFWQLTLG